MSIRGCGGLAALTGCAIHFGYKIICIEMILGAGDYASLDMMNIALLVVFTAATILISLIAIVVRIGYVLGVWQVAREFESS